MSKPEDAPQVIDMTFRDKLNQLLTRLDTANAKLREILDEPTYLNEHAQDYEDLMTEAQRLRKRIFQLKQAWAA